MFLFKVKETFLITGRGLILVPESEKTKVRVGKNIKIIRPDKSTFEAVIKGIVFNEHQDICIENLSKADVPDGSEIWLCDVK